MQDHVTLLYRSIASRADFDPSDLAILRTALRFNAAHGITGFLCRANSEFFQALHGRSDVVDALMARISHDPRHSDVEVLLREASDVRSPFPDWSMGYDHFLADQLGLGRGTEPGRPPINADQAQDLLAAIIDLAQEVNTYGSAFPYARAPGEAEGDYLRRLDLVG